MTDTTFRLFVCLIFCWFNLSAQETNAPVNYYPEGIYLSYEDFLARSPSNTNRIEARDVMRPKQVIADPFIDNCYFYYRRKNKRVKDAFAISYRGSLYIHIKSMRKLMEKKDRKQKIDFQDSFIRVVDQGKFLYMEGYFRRGGGLGLSIGGGPVSVGTGGSKEELRGIIFDFDRGIFDLFRDCQDFNEFLQRTSERPLFTCDQKKIPMEIVRKLILDINHVSEN